jgi:hypothetical protein
VRAGGTETEFGAAVRAGGTETELGAVVRAGGTETEFGAAMRAGGIARLLGIACPVPAAQDEAAASVPRAERASRALKGFFISISKGNFCAQALRHAQRAWRLGLGLYAVHHSADAAEPG